MCFVLTTFLVNSFDLFFGFFGPLFLPPAVHQLDSLAPPLVFTTTKQQQTIQEPLKIGPELSFLRLKMGGSNQTKTKEYLKLFVKGKIRGGEEGRRPVECGDL